MKNSHFICYCTLVFTIICYKVALAQHTPHNIQADTLYLKNGIKLAVDILEESRDEIKYRKMDDEKKTFLISSQEVVSVFYNKNAKKSKRSDPSKKTKFDYLLATGISFSGATAVIAEQLDSLGFNQDIYGENGPLQKIFGLIFGLGIDYRFHQNFKAKINLGLTHNTKVIGRQYAGSSGLFQPVNYNEFEVRNLTLSLDAGVGFNTTNQKMGIFGGLSLFKNQIRFEKKSTFNTDSIGFHLGGYFRILDRDWGYLGISSAYRQMPKITTTPYQKQHDLVFPATTINPSHMNIEIFIGSTIVK